MMNKTYRDIILGDSPDIFWRFDDTAGVADSSGNKHDGFATGGSITRGTASGIVDNPASDFTIQGFQEGAVGTSIQLAQTTGQQDYVVSYNTLTSSYYYPFTNNNAITVEGWAYRNDNTHDDTLVGIGNFGYLAINTGTNDISLWMDRSVSVTASATWAGAWPGSAVWTYWALVIDPVAVTATLYINGLTKGTVALANSTVIHGGALANGYIVVGGGYFTVSYNYLFRGKLDEIALYQYALNDFQILQHYNYGINPDPIFKESVRSFPDPDAAPVITFDFSPHYAAYSYSVGATTYTTNAFYAQVGATVTFTATTAFGDPLTQSALGYEWDFGDGTKGFGNPVTHKYTAPNIQLQVGLTVTDNNGQRFHVPKPMYLKT